VTGRFSRVPLQPLPYKEWVIPAHVSPNQFSEKTPKEKKGFLTHVLFRPASTVCPTSSTSTPRSSPTPTLSGLNAGSKLAPEASIWKSISSRLPRVAESVLVSSKLVCPPKKTFYSFFLWSSVLIRSSLAYAELYLTVAALVQNFDLELVGSSVEDIIPYRDFGLAFNEKYDFGVDFKVKRVLSV